MKEQMIKGVIQKGKTYLVIAVLVLLAELFLFNFSTWNTMFCEPVVLAEEVETDEQGIYQTEMTKVDVDVKNVSVDLVIDGYDRANVTVFVTDEGDAYEYPMPEYEVVSGMKGSGYRNIYPFGKVDSIRVMVTVPQGTVAHISSVVVNDNRPLDLKPLRILLVAGVFMLGCAIFKDHAIMKMPCKRGCIWQIGLSVGSVLVLLFVGHFIMKSNPTWMDPPWPHHEQYQQLARALEQGTVVVDGNPDPALMEKENPYDTIALQAEGINYRPDYAYYDGNYYVYFGIIPELQFYYPHYLRTGEDLQTNKVVFYYYCMLVVGVFGTVWELVHRFGKKLPFVWYLILGTMVSLVSNYVFMLGRPDMYNVPIMAGSAYAFLGTFFWMRAVWTSAKRGLWLALGSFCIACIMGCRPQLGLYAVVLFSVLFLPQLFRKEQRKEWKWYDAVAFMLPIIAIGAVVFWYNLARFGSGFDFGATYSLTSNDMNHRGFNFSRVFRGLYSFLFQPPTMYATFPFLESGILTGDYMGRNIVEFCFGGVFFTCPILLVLAYLPLGGRKHLEKEAKWLITGMSVAAFIIAVFDINAAGILQRYMGDMVLGFVIAAIIVVICLLNRYRESGTYIWMAKVMYIAVLCGIAFSFLVFISSESSTCLQECNPPLYHTIRSYFML